MRNVNQQCLELIEEFEGFSEKPYICPAGKPTIGIGTTFYPDGKKVTMSDPHITKAEAYELMGHELDELETMINNYLRKINLYLNENQFSALVSFAYNCGIAPVISGGRSLNAALKSKDIKKIADTILIYNKVTDPRTGEKVISPGLKRRREAERNLFLS